MANMVNFQFVFSFATAISFFFLCFSSSEAQRGGFSLELIHRDSPRSPFYNPNESPYQRIAKTLHRSVNRISHFRPTFISPKAAQADIISDGGEYLMNISLGTPPVEALAIADTGSDLIWTQCKPCTGCFEQKAPLFDPQGSSTYKDISCESRQCEVLDQTACSNDQTCQYSVSYGDSSFSNGNLAVDTVTLGSTSGRPVALPKTIFGCGHDDGGTFGQNTTGIVGLGGGAVSLITQMGDSISGKFSYCLIPLESSEKKISSKLNFGSNGIVSGTGVVSTPLVSKSPASFYYLTLEAISVGKQRFPFGDSSVGPEEGNIIIDSGTTLTLLPQDFVAKLVSTLSNIIQPVPVQDPNGLLDLCYPYSSDFEAPNLTVHFSGADVVLSTANTFVRVSEKVVCFTFKGQSEDLDDLSIYGNLAQTNFLVGYDTQGKTVSFKPTDCTKV